MRTIEYDDSRWPLVIVRYSAMVDENEFPTLLELTTKGIKAACADRTKICMIYDASLGYAASPRVRKMQAEWMVANKDVMPLVIAGTAFVFTSVVVRGVLTAVLWVSDMTVPYKVLATMPEAERWGLKQLAMAQPAARVI